MKVLEKLNVVEKKVDSVFSVLLDDLTLGNKKDVMYLENKDFFDKTCKLLQKFSEEKDVIVQKRANEILDKIKINFENFKELNQNPSYYSNTTVDSLLKRNNTTETEENDQPEDILYDSDTVEISFKKTESEDEHVNISEKEHDQTEVANLAESTDVYLIVDEDNDRVIDQYECESTQEFLDILNANSYPFPVTVFKGELLSLQLKYYVNQ